MPQCSNWWDYFNASLCSCTDHHCSLAKYRVKHMLKLSCSRLSAIKTMCTCHSLKHAAGHQEGHIGGVTFVLHLTLGASWGYDVEMTKSNTKLPALQQHTRR